MSIATRPGYSPGHEWPPGYEWVGQDDWPSRHRRGGRHYNRHGRAWHAGPALIGVMVLGFIFCWPVGVAALALTIWSMKMTCGHHGGAGRWGEHWQERMMARRARWEQKFAEHQRHRQHAGSGNRAFDEYRAETLRRLEDEEKEFREFLNQLRFAKDKAEFDDFLANRRPPAAPEATAQN